MRRRCRITDRSHANLGGCNISYMRIGPKYKIAKRLGAGVFEKAQTQKFMLSESRSHKSKRRSTPKSDYGKQFLEKQKVRFTYGITERQLRNYIREVSASKRPGAEHLFELIERRLDNVVYRFGLAPTRRAARQMVSHGHIVVDGKRVTIPSYRVSAPQLITIRAGSRAAALFRDLPEKFKEYNAPAWLSFDLERNEGKVLKEPKLLGTPLHYELAPVLEFYSR